MIEKLLEELLVYAEENLYLSGYNIIYKRNLLMSLFGIIEPYGEKLTQEEKTFVENLDVPDFFINKLCEYAKEKKLCNRGMELSFASMVMGLLSPEPQEIVCMFSQIKDSQGIKAACDYLYGLSIKNNYIQKTAINKNIKWRADFDENFLEITINLSKPEKDNKEILRQLKQPATSYPKCLLCIENLGFEGNLSKAPRQNIRFIPVEIAGESWFLQYSPYLYYDEHCILISSKHCPMNVNKDTFVKLADFVDEFPNYFMGSNASLPIVGGSILSHEHFQGGGYKMPLHYAKDDVFYESGIKGVVISRVNWYNSVIRIKSADRENLFKAAGGVFDCWSSYSDESCGIIDRTEQQHNAVTPIIRKENGEYILDLILRNNRTDEKYPDGIFHAHPEYHNIKKEGIGLIEAMGLFILPARLKAETEEIKKVLCNKRKYGEDLNIHKGMIETILGVQKIFTETEADKAVRKYIGDACKNILINTAVFKSDSKGRQAFDKFVKSIKW